MKRWESEAFDAKRGTDKEEVALAEAREIRQEIIAGLGKRPVDRRIETKVETERHEESFNNPFRNEPGPPGEFSINEPAEEREYKYVHRYQTNVDASKNIDIHLI